MATEAIERSWRPTVVKLDQAVPMTAFFVRFGELSIDSAIGILGESEL